MKIYLVRHGQTDLNKERRMQGRNGLPLNEEGIRQAKQLAKKLEGIEFDIVISSPQERAMQTVQIASGIVPQTDERINVYDLGCADREKVEDVKTINGVIPDPSIYDGVEEIPHFIARVNGFMEELCDKYSGQDINILLGGHKCTTGAISAFFEGMPSDGNFLELSVKNGEYKIFEN